MTCPHIPKNNPFGATTCLKCTFPDGLTMADLGNHIQEMGQEPELDGLLLAQNEKQFMGRTVFRFNFSGVPINFMAYEDVKSIVGLVEQKAKVAEREVCICAAIQLLDRTVFRGHRHFDCFRTAQDNGRTSEIAKSEQGFITSTNRFVTREEGRKLQDAAGIPLANKLEGYMENTLFSEDLY